MRYRILMSAYDAQGEFVKDFWVEAEGASLWEASGKAQKTLNSVGFTQLHYKGQVKREVKTETSHVEKFIAEFSQNKNTKDNAREFAAYLNRAACCLSLTEDHLTSILDTLPEGTQGLLRSCEKTWQRFGKEDVRLMDEAVWKIAVRLSNGEKDDSGKVSIWV